MKIILFLLFFSKLAYLQQDPTYYNVMSVTENPNLQQQQPQEEENQLPKQKIEGKIRINGQLYETICECITGKIYFYIYKLLNCFYIGDEQQKTDLAYCDPSKLKLIQDKKGIAGFTKDELAQFIGNPRELTFANIASTPFTCLDGRHTQQVIATPGGDAGEFILGLFVYEGMLGFGKQLTQEEIDLAFSKYLSQMQPQKFSMCTDDIALEHLERDTGIAISIDVLRNAPQAIQQTLLEALMSSQNHGCEHIKHLLRNPEYYSLRLPLVQMFLKSFFKILWERKNPLRQKLDLENLVGTHDEQAFVEVKSNEACNSAGIAPLILTKKNNKSILVNHLDASNIRRQQIAAFFAQKFAHHLEQPIDQEVFLNRMNKFGLAYLAVTGTYMAKNLPFYTICPE